MINEDIAAYYTALSLLAPWDLTHVAHVEFLRACKNLGNPLVVGVRVPNQKPGRPIMTAEERVGVIAEFESVDYVFTDETGYTKDLINRIRPKTVIFSTGETPSPQKQAEMNLLVQAFPELKISHIPRQRDDISTTEIIERILGPAPILQGEPIELGNIKKELFAYSERSNAEQKNAAFLVNDLGLVISKGVNYHPEAKGTVIFSNEQTHEFKEQKPRPTHAEVDCIVRFIREGGRSFKGFSLYTSTMPCAGCAEQIVRYGIPKLVYFKDFDNNYGELILKNGGVIVERQDN
ncbi:MAG: Cytidine/deoxycytidylate deaminase family protein [Microgenomates group bacterium GW2011_GWA1_46_15]|nr:MAG: Cytidine/deoxycytidylate deaminase family protein [Microgenomates group bacterium GW2011_GWB1_45_17]KKU23548.1 MAG: Cytidine/deoxycytidylate deaminase family protein [Microgenomates group bacterium GW2011_GWC1_46_15]KKU24267.1 MAG: Cytidine/deoxycytidylate deaminase family protein [Microgenomates group bacterium GW2011_GWA1_46_15]